MSITTDKEKKLKSSLKSSNNKIIDQYSVIIKSLEEKKKDLLNDFVISNDETLNKLNNSFNLSIENFALAPLGKDLRRNISYTMIITSLKTIAKTSFNIYKFLIMNKNYKMSQKWIIDLSNEIINNLKAINNLLDNENPEEAYVLIEKDELETNIYKKEIKSITKKIEPKDKLTIAEKDELIISFILTMKSFEHAGNSIKEIAKFILFIPTGKLN